jgi:hypothetical protein
MEHLAMSNLGTLDRIARLVAGSAIIIAALLFGAGAGTLPTIAGIGLGAVLLGTALIGFCPLYALLGLSSRRREVN